MTICKFRPLMQHRTKWNQGTCIVSNQIQFTDSMLSTLLQWMQTNY